MYNSIKLAFILVAFVYVKAQYRRSKILNSLPYRIDEKDLINKWNDNAISACMKRSMGQDDLGPFWANRGKRYPNYMQEHLYANEPSWVLIKKDDILNNLEEPFFTSRGKKDANDDGIYRNINLKFRDRREFPQVVETPFFAARGKKIKSRNDQF